MDDRGNVYDLAERRRQQKQAPEPFIPFYAAQMQGVAIKALEWILDSLILRNTVALFTGPPKMGKSVLLQQMLTAIALGQPWLGHATVPLRVFGLFTEDPQEIVMRRQRFINSYYDVQPADYEYNYSWEARDTRDGTLIEFEKFSDRPSKTALWSQLVNHIKDDGIQLITLDPAGVVFGGGENFRRQVTVFIRELQKLAAWMNGAVVLSAHPAKGDPKGYSGSSAWLGSVRYAMSLHRPSTYDEETGQDRDVRILRGLGANYAAANVNDRLIWDKGLYVIDGDAPQVKRLDRVERQELEYRLLIGVRRIIEQGGKVAGDELDRMSVASRCRRQPEFRTISLNDINRAVDALIDTGRLVRVDVAKRCLLRPAEGPNYPDERGLWLATMPTSNEAAD